MTNDLTVTEPTIEERVAALEAKTDDTQMALMMMSTAFTAAFVRVKEELDKMEAGAEQAFEIIDNNFFQLAVIIENHQNADDSTHAELADELRGLKEFVDTIATLADEADDEMEANRAEAEDAWTDADYRLTLLQDTTIALWSACPGEVREAAEARLNSFRGQREARAALAQYCEDDVAMTVGVDLSSEDGDEAVAIYSAEDIDEFSDMMAEIQSDDTQPQATILRIDPDVAGGPITAETVPEEFLLQAKASVPDCIGVYAIDFTNDPMTRDQLVTEAFDMIDDAEVLGEMDVDILNMLRLAFSDSDTVEELNEIVMEIVAPGFITSTLGMFATMTEGNEDDGVYIITVSSTEDVAEIVTCLFLVNMARSGIEF